MITVYKKKTVPKDMELVTVNDLFFNKNTIEIIGKDAERIIEQIDGSKLVSSFAIESKFDGSKLNIDKLSTGCKTALNIMYFPDKVFDISECGDNALDIIFAMEKGNIYCDYAKISFNMTSVIAHDKKSETIYTDYDELKAWWDNEN